MTRVLLLAHGDGRRWDGFLDQPKHFVVVDGETLLARTVRLMADRGCEVVVVAPDGRYDVPGASRETLDGINVCGSDMGKILDSRHLWASGGRTVIMWGDCYYTEHVADLVAAHDDGSYHVWRRPGRSRVTGARWDESLAVSFGPDEHDRVTVAAERVAAAVRDGAIPSSHIRTHLAAMCGVDGAALDDVRHTATLPAQTHVDDWSDDFDSPDEWRTWMRRRWTHDGRKVGVCIPWCGGDQHRTDSYQWVSGWYERMGLPIYTGGDIDGEWPNRSAMRNRAAAAAINDGCDVLFFADADTFVDADQLWGSVCLAWHTRRQVLAFDRYVRTGRHHARQLMRRWPNIDHRFVSRMSTRGASVWRAHASGAFAIHTDLFTDIGGYDERFARWGYEDRALWLAAGTVGGFAPRIPGSAFHWWHPTPADKDRKAPDSIDAARLARRYYLAAAWKPEAGAVLRAIDDGLLDPIDLADDARPDRDAMRSILAEPGGPLADLLLDA